MNRRQFKILPILTLFFWWIFLPSFGEVVKKIEVSGNQRIADETI